MQLKQAVILLGLIVILGAVLAAAHGHYGYYGRGYGRRHGHGGLYRGYYGSPFYGRGFYGRGYRHSYYPYRYSYFPYGHYGSYYY